MNRALKPLCRLLPLAVLAAAVAVSAPAAAAAAAGCQTTSKAVRTTNAKNAKQAKKLIGDTSYTPVIRTYHPKPTSTSHDTGYQTIAVRSPQGTAPVVGYFTLQGSEACSVVVTSAQVVLSRNAYLVKLKFPGEQGDPGKLKVVLVSR